MALSMKGTIRHEVVFLVTRGVLRGIRKYSYAYHDAEGVLVIKNVRITYTCESKMWS
jgi:hypothetical protein